MDEKAAIRAAQKGDAQAFNRLVLIYQGLAYNVAYRMLGDEDSAADATQDAFLSAYRAIGQFRGGSFKAWLLRIVTNACYDQLRRQQRRPSTSLDDLIVDSDHSTLFEDERETPEHHAMRQELAQEIQQGLRTLPVEQRVTLILSDIQGLSYEEIAAVTGTSLGTVKSRLSRGRARLRDYLRETGELLSARYRLHSESPK